MIAFNPLTSPSPSLDIRRLPLVISDESPPPPSPREKRKQETGSSPVLGFRFEKLDITPKSAQKIKPVLERWMKEAEER